jgi:hypothetical protein
MTKSIKKWAAAVGSWNFENNGNASYLNPASPPQHPFGICVSEVQFSEGEARTTIKLLTRSPGVGEDSCRRILLGYRSVTDEYLTVGIGGYGNAYTLSHFTPTVGWQGIVRIGSASDLIRNHDYNLSVRLQGQKMRVKVNNIPVFEHVINTPLLHGQLGLFAWGQGGVQFRNTSVTQQPGNVFVVMKFSDKYKKLYAEAIKPVTKSFKLRAYHAGEVFGPGLILNDIVRGIITSKIVIAEITPANKNVFYELGYAHALRKTTILLAEKGKKLPFDISGYRCLFYDHSKKGMKQVQEDLKKHLTAILDE